MAPAALTSAAPVPASSAPFASVPLPSSSGQQQAAAAAAGASNPMTGFGPTAEANASGGNTLDDRERVGLVDNDSAVVGDGTITITLPPVSWTVLALSR